MINRLRNLPVYALIMLAAAFLMVVIRILDPAPVARIRASVFDYFQTLKPRAVAQPLTTKVVAIDERSLKEIGQWPWPRSRMADLVARLSNAGAKAVVLDMLFAEPDRLSPKAFADAYLSDPDRQSLRDEVAALPPSDNAFARTLETSRSVLAFVGSDAGLSGKPALKGSFAMAGDSPAESVPGFRQAIVSLTELNDVATGLGAANWVPDMDQIIRRVPLLVRVGDGLYPSLSLEALRVSDNQDTIFVKSSGSSGLHAFGRKTGVEFVRVGQRVVATNERGELWIHFSKPPRDHTISASQVLSDDFDPKSVAGRIVFIGATATGLNDLRATPLSAAMPGVEIHAQAVEQILAGHHLVRPPYATGLEIILIIAGVVLFAWLIASTGAVGGALSAICVVGAIALGAYWAFAHAGVLVDPVYPSLSLAVVYVAGMLTNFVRSEVARQRIRTAFSSYVAPGIVEQLVDEPDKLRLGGEMRDVTILFADVRNFSALSEGRDPEELVHFVNELFTELSRAIFDAGGTVDKYMGDAVMAFWNAPVANSRHAEVACGAALEMLRNLEELNARKAMIAKRDGSSFTPIRIGIGINSGLCCVGNVGSPDRFDYSVLGDCVNVAARLEQLTKIYHVPVIVGETSADAAERLAFIELDRVVPRGKREAQAIYALYGDEQFAQSEAFQKFKAWHAEIRSALSGGDVEAAAAAIAQCKALDTDTFAGLIDYCETALRKEKDGRHSS